MSRGLGREGRVGAEHWKWGGAGRLNICTQLYFKYFCFSFYNFICKRFDACCLEMGFGGTKTLLTSQKTRDIHFLGLSMWQIKCFTYVYFSVYYQTFIV